MTAFLIFIISNSSVPYKIEMMLLVMAKEMAKYKKIIQHSTRRTMVILVLPRVAMPVGQAGLPSPNSSLVLRITFWAWLRWDLLANIPGLGKGHLPNADILLDAAHLDHQFLIIGSTCPVIDWRKSFMYSLVEYHAGDHGDHRNQHQNPADQIHLAVKK